MKKSSLCRFSGFVLLFATVFLSSCRYDAFRVNPSSTFETRSVEVSGISRLDVGSAFDLILIKGEEESLTVEANDNLFPYIVIETRGDVLRACFRYNTIVRNYRVTITYTYRDLSQINLHGAATCKFADPSVNFDDITLLLSGASRLEYDSLSARDLLVNMSGASTCVTGGTKASSLDIDLSGATKFKGRNMNVLETDIDISGASLIEGTLKGEQLEAELSGASRIRLQGLVNRLDLNVAGGSYFEDYAFWAETAEVEMAGASSARLGVTRSLRVNASGASTLIYDGNPSVTIRSQSGGSTIEKR